jgi:peptidoglycan/xylan/chitin deacetylase (PgdA/CDA1 family)
MRVKYFIRSRWAEACAALGILDRIERRSGRRLAVLCYHRILPLREKSAYLNPDLAVTPEGFRAQCEALAARYDVRPLSAAADQLREGHGGERPLAAITFDDGYRDNFKHAVPVLDGLGLKATFFVVAGLVGSAEAPWYDRLGRAVARLIRAGRLEEGLRRAGGGLDGGTGRSPRAIVQAAKRLAPEARQGFVAEMAAVAGADDPDPELDLIMGWEELAVLARGGHEIGSHSVSHEMLPALSDEAVDREIRESKQSLERRLGAPVRAFCYPNGDFDGRCLRALQASGYCYACTTRAGDNPAEFAPLELRRRFICEDRLRSSSGRLSPALFRLELSGLADALFHRGKAA